MKLNKIFSLLIALVVVTAGCDYNDKYFDGLDELSKPTDIKKVEYTLTDEDYATIANNATNKALAAAKGVASELAALATTKGFTDVIPAADYLPAFLEAKYKGADNSSAVRVTYNKSTGNEEYVQQLNKAATYLVTAADYETVWGEGSSTNFFTPSTTAATNVPGILKVAFPEAVAGDMVVVDYNESAEEPSGTVTIFEEDFASITANQKPAVVPGWNNVVVAGTSVWEGKYFSNNGYIQASAFYSETPLDVYMISPKITVEEDYKLSFDACYGNYKSEGGELEVLISTDLNGFYPMDVIAASWDNITQSFTIEVPTTQYGELKPVGKHPLDNYVGTDIYIAFRYIGDKKLSATTTVQVDNVIIRAEPDDAQDNEYVATNGIFSYDGTNWSAFSGNAYMLKKSDFKAMGINYDNFSESMPASDYLPTFLKLKFPYAQAGDNIAVAYKYYASSKTSIRADEYEYNGSEWIKKLVTDQFVKTDGKWMFDPSVVITLKPARDIAESIIYYQPIVDYVRKTHGDDYLQSRSSGGVYDNAEYYYGASSYQNNMDFRTTAWKTSSKAGPAQYAQMTDEQLTALMFERLPEAFIPALVANHSDMAPIEGVEVTCTINFGVYTGTTLADCNYQIKYKVTGKGEFEYIEDSLIKTVE